ncbi:amidophosphoribosyltransferase [Pedosphaera parvula]|uniref:Amidophosphoribosyltransferase n=1 Tax=Pedosphaera parvula (strain Ellin514) TaxID=320771 RepID=B9XQX8_PEDPL|nr:amidophosphoribosyltransferase [Pedosphaera parvula]EEF57755.1 amidophosphoribosyltransferase [Pedosphaera parvula Ellin514]
MQHYPKHYCGVFGIFGHPNAAQLTYYGLYALQHRGQESAGIVTSDNGHFNEYKGMGLVSQIFKGEALSELTGNMAIGHTRYSTTGSSHIRNAQPLTGNCRLGRIAIAHNGNLTNAAQVRDELEAQGLMFQTTVDSEIVLNLLAQPTLGGHDNNLIETVRRIEGAYSLCILTERELIGVRDPHGFRPLSIGKVDGAYVLASETCAFDLIHAEFIRDVEPGEIVVIDKNGLRSIKAFPEHQRRAFCIFEYVYFARPDSTIADRNVYKVRVEMGRELAREHPVKADLVIPVPDSGNCAALGYSLESGIPFEMAFVRNHYVGRSFLQPSQLIRDFDVRVKLNLIGNLVKGKRVIVVDDSIVRGTTSKSRVNNLKEAGAKEVHVMVSCPPHMNPCVYGIDFPDRSKLMAANHSLEEIRQYLNADSLHYLSQDGMVKATGLPKSNFCMACYDGNYPVKYDSMVDKHIMERRVGKPHGLGEELKKEELQKQLL